MNKKGKRSWWTKSPKNKSQPKETYRKRYVVEEMRAHKIKTLKDREEARNFIHQRKYTKPGVYKIRVEKIKKGW